uniref:FZ domain-containing protein n=1 Tax=Sarcophilus harrisii TaxID=9305 RepID=A0A7N4NNE6_SARHA
METRGSMERLLLALVGLCVSFQRAGAAFPRSSSRCTFIPRNMALCYDIGYSEMRIPNLLEHETMAEVIQQSSSWLPLLARECHPDARVFLCSLFAPICLDRIIYPCRSLCESVRDSCAPIMACYGYPWPQILHCDNFPMDHSLCISAITDEMSTSRRSKSAFFSLLLLLLLLLSPTMSLLPLLPLVLLLLLPLLLLLLTLLGLPLHHTHTEPVMLTKAKCSSHVQMGGGFKPIDLL